MAESEAEKRERIMRRLAEILKGPPPSSGGGPVMGGSLEAAIGALGLGLSEEDTTQVADAVREGPNPEETAQLLQTLLEAFHQAKSKDESD